MKIVTTTTVELITKIVICHLIMDEMKIVGISLDRIEIIIVLIFHIVLSVRDVSTSWIVLLALIQQIF
jgi:hypothetical protein